jgi:hypothetical protein
VVAGSWLGTTGRYGAVSECDGFDQYVEMDPITEVQDPTGPHLAGYGCSGFDIEALPDASGVLVDHCGAWYVVSGGRATRVTKQLDGVLAGNVGVKGRAAPTPATTPASASTFQPPQTIHSTTDVVQTGNNMNGIPYQLPGTVWPTAGLAEARVTLSSSTLMGLTCGCGQAGGDPYGYYPTRSVDGGKTWRVAGPEIGLAGGGHGGYFADRLLVLAGDVVVAWGQGANGVHVSTDEGEHWYSSNIPDSVDDVSVDNGQLIVKMGGDINEVYVPGRYVYRSTDQGRSWQLQP